MAEPLDPFAATEPYACLRLLRALRAKGLPEAPGATFGADDLAGRLAALPRFRPLLGALIEVLQRGGIVEPHGSGHVVVSGRNADAELSVLPALRADLLRQMPGLEPHLTLLDVCTERLCDVLAGQVPATEILFPGGAMELVEPVYKGNVWADHFNGMIARAAAQAVPALAAHDPAMTIRIIEIGAGTGGTTAAVLPAVAEWAAQLRYDYTDISPGFVAHGRRSFAGVHPFLAFRILDIESEPEAQGFAAADYDLIIASNVLHATRDVAASTHHIARLLRPGGLLLLNELTRTGAFATLTFGLLDGWCRFEDAERRAPHGPIVPAATWRDVLCEAGFGANAVYGWKEDPEASFQCLFVAERDAEARAATAPFEDVHARVTAEIATLLGLEPREIVPDRPFAEFGVDSIVAPQLVASLNRSLGCTLGPTDVFNYATVHDLAAHIAETTSALPSEPATPEPAPIRSTDIAVIGLACRVPGAENAGAFWDNLVAGRCSITEVPRERWDCRPLYDPEGRPGSINSRWGGFLADHDKFDPEFFRLSYREAEAMSPQQRVFLEAAWHAIEDAGYAPRDLSGTRCGVFVGVASHDYGPEIADSRSALGNSTAILAARISYLLNLKGPSLPVDTACSSSLVSIHLACRSILAGECDTALAGGVSILLTDPRLHRFLSDSGMASPTGQCHAFDAAADGFVPGEGVGVVLLKPLARAIADGDHIWGVVKGSAINQDGKTSGITAPNGPSQTALECEVYDAAEIDPRDIDYVEAHGTGTPLGDPIEVNALTTAFRRYTDAAGFCALGSVKTNIGHLLTAAGVASFIKVLLALDRETIPPSLNFATANPQIDFAGSPFYVNTESAPWPRRAGRPRRAAISSFGFSGTNAHVLVEEAPALRTRTERSETRLFLVSARSEAQLAARLAGLADWLAHNDPPLADLAFTLVCGRAHFEHRCAILATTRHELLNRLAAAQAGETAPEILRGCATGEAQAALDRELAQALGRHRAEGADLYEIGRLYCRGADGDWRELFGAHPPRRLSLPGYPFERLRFWIDAPAPVAAVRAAGLHPLLTANASTLDGLRYRLNLDPEAFFLADHRHQGRPLLPAAAALEAVRAAAQEAGLGEFPSLGDIAWRRPLYAGNDRAAFVELVRGEDDTVRFRIRSGEGPEAICHAEGHIEPAPAARLLPVLDIAALATGLPQSLGHSAVYELFERLGFAYGPGFRVIEGLRTDSHQVLAELALPAHLEAESGEYLLHPALLDGAIQATIGLALGSGGLPQGTVVPMSLGELAVHGPIPPRCIVHVRQSGDGSAGDIVHLDIRIAGPAGNPVAELRDLAVHIAPGMAADHRNESPPPSPVIPAKAGIHGSAAEVADKWVPAFAGTTGLERQALRNRQTVTEPILFYLPEWRATATAPGPVHRQRLMLFIRNATQAAGFTAEAPRVVPGTAFARQQAGRYTVEPGSEADFAALWRALAGDDRLPDTILHLWNWDAPPLDFAGRPGAPALVGAVEAQLAAGLWPLANLIKTMPSRPPSRPLDIVYFHRPTETPEPQHAMLAGFAASVALEDAAVRLKTVALEPGADPARALGAASGFAEAGALHFEGGVLRVRRFRQCQPGSERVPLRRGGAYLITGGSGGIGRHLARHLARNWQARLALLGRSPESDTTRSLCNDIAALGGEAIYLAADVADEAALCRALDRARHRFGLLNGVIHAAGVTRDGFLRRKNADEIAAVLAPKLAGTIHLDHATAGDPLDFFCCFGSLGGVLGNVGQSDYAAANAFLDGFAAARLGPGRSVSIDWSYWREGGLRNGADGDAELFAATGMRWLDTEPALTAFEQALTAPGPQVLVVAGDPARIEGFLNRETEASAPAAEAHRTVEEPLDAAIRYLIGRLAEATGIPAERIQPRRAFEEYGIDSMLVTKLNAALERDFGHLSKTLFYEHPDIRSLAAYLAEHYAARIAAIEGKPAITVTPPAEQPAPAILGKPDRDDGAIAIIGVAGRYPGADDLDGFWEALAAGRDLVTEIPPERWDHSRYFDPDPRAPGKTYSKWGGFLRAVDRFDPLFFNIAPGDAARMDPQERLFLETAWEAIENAGHTRASLAGPDGGRAVGVYVGVMYGDYQLYTAEEHLKGNPVYGAAPYWSIANRVSYALDLHGPSLAVDSACSSSLVAVHLACQSLRSGECAAALAGGVNLNLHPLKYLALAQGRFASSDGRCRSFGAGGDGYVPGEGVGAVLLKPLAAALRDGDYIHGLIRASAANHGGKTNGYTVPSPVRQAAVIREALHRGGIDPASIGYVEAHGTGTALGDPIEIAGLSQAFGDGLEPGSCALGSLKANIGHLEAAAGIAGLTKVLLQMRHGRLAPMPSFGPDNPNIDFAATPFRLQRQLAPWEPREGVRRAGVSSFGAGGANAHVVVEDYPNAREAAATEAQLFVLSARSAAQLDAYRARLRIALAETPFALADIAWSLIVGREAMEERLAFVAGDIDEAIACLGDDADNNRVLRGRVDPDRLIDPHALPAGVGRADLLALARHWAAGAEIPWVELGFRGRRVPLPPHPFLGKRYWLPVTEAAPVKQPAAPAGLPVFIRRFGPDDPLVRDHRVGGRRLLPGVAHLDLLQAAIAGLGGPWQIQEIAWLAPLVVGDAGAEVQVGLSRGAEAIDFTIRGDAGETLSRGRLVGEAAIAPPPIDLAGLHGIAERCWSAAAIYQRFAALGLDYGPSFRLLSAVRVAGDEALADLKPGDIAGESPPQLLDAGLQALIGFLPDNATVLHIPFALGAVRRFGPLDQARRVHARRKSGGAETLRFDLAFLDGNGRVLLTLEDLAARQQATTPANAGRPLRYLRPVWRRDPPPVIGNAVRPGSALVLSAAAGSAVTATLVAGRGEAPVREMVLGTVDDRAATLDRRDPESYRRAFALCPDLSSIYFAAGLALGAVDQGPYDLARAFLALLQALDRSGLAGRGIRLVVLTESLQAVDGPPADPAAATLIGLAKTAAQEYPRLEILCLDVDPAALADAGLGARLEAEQAARPAPELAYRGPRRYRRILTPLALPTDGPDPLPDEPVVLILGGARGIGLELGAHLAHTRRARLALVGRSTPDRSLDARLAGIRNAGGEALYFQADGCDREAMAQVVAAVKKRWGPIDAAVHSALVLCDVSLARMDPEALRAALDPKIRATKVLREVLAAEPLKLFALFSSANVFAGAAGQGNYVAGIAFADAFAERLAATSDWPVVTIDWGLWGEIGSVADAETAARLAAQGVHPIAPAEGLAAFEAVLRSGLGRVAVVKIADDTLAAHGISPDAEPALRAAGADRSALDIVAPIFTRPAPAIELPQAEAAFAAVETWGRRAVCVALGRIAELPAGKALTFEGLRRRLGVFERHLPLLRALLRMLAADGALVEADGLWRIGADQVAAEAAMRTARDTVEAVRARQPWIGEPLALLERCLDAYPEILCGRRDPLEVLFPGGAVGQAERIYDGSPIVDHFNARLAETVAAFVRTRRSYAPPRPVRILEVGAGTGGTTASVLAALAPCAENVDYVYSDIGASFLRHGEARFGADNPSLRFAIYDLEQEPEANGVEPGSFDLVLGTNVLHATASLAGTLRRLRRVLARHGLLLINEITRPQDFATLVFGLTEGWWRAGDPEDRLSGPLASAEQWSRLLYETGYRGVCTHGLSSADGASPQTLIVAESDGWIEPAETGTVARPRQADPVAVTASPSPLQREGPFYERAVDYLADIFVAVLKVDRAELRPDEHFDRYGMESLSALDIRDRIGKDIPGLSATLLFEHNTLARLAAHLTAEHRTALATMLGEADPPAPSPTPAPTIAAPAILPRPDNRDVPIAIIGVSGRYPGAPTLDAFWRLLVEGRSAITTVPAERWDAEAWFDPSGKAEDRAYTKWGGFIADPDKFDPLFFGIAPLEAEAMDPQERLFLEAAWAVLEDAGYTPARLRRACARAGGDSEDVGIFVGVMNAAYQWLAAEAWQAGNAAAGASAYWSIANRVSYQLDFGGPSLAIDSACSSSLTAIHLACESLRRGECQAAIAGGVNLILHPRQLVNLSRARMLSHGPECRAFGEGADGFVDGEGVGAVLLRPLSDAERDGDRIEAVILGSAVNAGGRTGGYTVPNPQAQGRLVRRALARAGAEPGSIGYIEAHGTGTALGDPIEIAGLKLAFGDTDGPRCAIGSVKANIGHLESAAGIAGLTKVILQFRHGLLAPAPHAATPNPLIDFAASPFALPDRAAAWKRRLREDDGETPRRAGISSFGAGGANAHLVVEEYPIPVRTSTAAPVEDLVVLSARSRERLIAQAHALLDFLEATEPEDPAHHLADVAHTLRLGREAMVQRLAILARDLAQLRTSLGAFIAGRDPAEGVFAGEANPRSGERILLDLPETRTAIDGLLARRELGKLARLWVEGGEIDWSALPVIGQRHILPLPTYPFRRERYSIAAPHPAAAPAEAEPARPAGRAAIPAMLTRVWREARAAAEWRPHGTVVVCTQDRRLYQEAAARSGTPAVWVRHGPAFRAHGDDAFEIAIDDAKSAAALLDHLRRAFPAPYRVLQLWRGAPDPLPPKDALLASFHLAKAALKQPAGEIVLVHGIGAGRDGPEALDAAFAAFARSVVAEHPGCRITSVVVEPDDDPSGLVARCLAEADIGGANAEHRYRDGRRLAPVIERAASPAADPAAIGFRARGVYLLVGGLGEVGYALTRELLTRYRVRAVILGRRGFGDEVQRRLAPLESLGGEVLYLSCDITDRAALEAALAQAKQRFGAIHGVLHLARAVDTGPLAALSTAAFRSVLAAKVAGTVNLDAALADEPLDWFVMFSSLAAWQGLPGAAAYATACAFQDAFATERARLVAEGGRAGHSVSIAWPQWAYDDFLDDRKAEQLRALGLRTLDAAAGVQAIEQALASGRTQVGFLAGEDAAIDALLADIGTRPASDADPDLAALDAMTDAELAAYLAYLREELAAPVAIPAPEPTLPASATALVDAVVDSFAAYLRIAPGDIGPDSVFADLGLDSIKALHIAERLQRRLGRDIAPAMFFEHPTAAALAQALSVEGADNWAQVAE